MIPIGQRKQRIVSGNRGKKGQQENEIIKLNEAFYFLNDIHQNIINM